MPSTRSAPGTRAASGHYRQLGLALLLLSGACASSRAESIACGGSHLSPGASRLQLLHACGQPSVADSHCAPLQPAALPPAAARHWQHRAAPVCVPVEEWLYDRGPGYLLAIVRISQGRVVSIGYSQRWAR